MCLSHPVSNGEGGIQTKSVIILPQSAVVGASQLCSHAVDPPGAHQHKNSFAVGFLHLSDLQCSLAMLFGYNAGQVLRS